MKLTNKHINVLDIQDRYVKCSQLINQDKKWSIGKSLQKEIQPIDRDQNTNQDIVSTIKSMLQEIGVSDNIIVSISGRDVSIKLLELPPMSDKKFKNIEGMLRYELGPQLPMDIDQMYYDYQIVEMDSGGTKLLTASIKRSVLTRYIDILSQAGVYPEVITISSTALFNAFVMSDPHKTGRPIGLVCLRESTGDVVIIEREHLIYARSFSISENNAIREINNSFDAYSKMRYSKAELDQMQVYLINSGEEKQNIDLTGVMTHISANLQWHILPDNCNLISGTAMSVVFKSVHSQFLKINLLRQVVQEKQKVRRKVAKTKLSRLAPSISMLIMLIISCLLWWQTNQAKGKLNAIETALQTNVKQFNNASTLRDTAKKLDKQIELLNWVTEDYPMVSYRLYRIAQMIPNDVWLKEVYIPVIRLDKKKKQGNPISKMNVVGYAQEQSQIESFLENLRRCDCFSDVRQEKTSEITIAGERVLEFKIVLVSSKYNSINYLAHTINTIKN